ncbi:MAG TPA: FHA domain-containing protein [Pseudonocardiaceae bacterium]|nr:FHA domain-containing protein [Pseudonocardiaceae bacterium]
MPTCPDGHHSEWLEYCSVCGVTMTATAHPAGDSCPHCDEPRIGPFCERCGHLHASAARPASASWCAVITPDRAYFEASGADTTVFTFPASSPARRVKLTDTTVRIGRRSASRGNNPEIDLADPPVDPGVSREHARLLAQPDGSWALVDDGSTNGTYVNGSSQRIPTKAPVPLADGDRVHLGVWTTITLHRDS